MGSCGMPGSLGPQPCVFRWQWSSQVPGTAVLEALQAVTRESWSSQQPAQG